MLGEGAPLRASLVTTFIEYDAVDAIVISPGFSAVPTAVPVSIVQTARARPDPDVTTPNGSMTATPPQPTAAVPPPTSGTKIDGEKISLLLVLETSFDTAPVAAMKTAGMDSRRAVRPRARMPTAATSLPS